MGHGLYEMRARGRTVVVNDPGGVDVNEGKSGVGRVTATVLSATLGERV